MSRMSSFYQSLNLQDASANDIVTNLTKAPRKDRRSEIPHTNVSTVGSIAQIDTLYLPEDDGYKYCLVIVDLADKSVDAEPMKNRSSSSASDALKTIFARKIVKQPLQLVHDAGSEFGGRFAQYWGARLKLRETEPGRHRQTSVVETKNALIGRVLNKNMLAQEINTGEKATHWVRFLPKVIKAINEHFKQTPKTIPPDAPIRARGDTAKLVEIGTEVRYQLDAPEDYLSEQRLHGTFRAGDIRWSREPEPVTNIYLLPDQPPMYKVGDNSNVAYTKRQLQIVKGETGAPSAHQQKWTVKEILQKVMRGRSVWYKVKWSDDSVTEVQSKTLTEDVPDMVKEFNNKNKKKK